VEERLPRKLAAILYADVVGYSRMASEDEDATHRRLKESLDLIATTVMAYHGRVINYSGDAALAMFEAVVDAVSCAAAIQSDMVSLSKDIPDERKIQFRIGVNLGDVIEDGGDIFGDGVNVAARLESLADPGGICISDAVRSAIGNKLALDYELMGEQKVKNITEPVRVHKVIVETEQNREANLPDTPLELLEKPSIAVLPFTNMSSEPEQEYFSDGIAEDIITALSKVSDLLVIARNSTFIYKDKAVDIKQVGREQGVRYVLEGSVRKASNRVRVTAQLVDTNTGLHQWAERYDRDLEDIFAVQDEITRNVVSALDVHLREGEQARFWSSGTENVEAWECVRLGSDLLNAYPSNPHEVQNYGRRAIELDPAYAAAWALLAWSNIHVSDDMTRPEEEREQALGSVRHCAQRALEYDPSCAEAYSALGLYNLSIGEYEAAAQNAKKSVELAPNHASSSAVAANILNKCGQPEKAIKLIRKAMRLSPFYPAWFLHMLGQASRLLGNTDAAIDAYQKLINRQPDTLIGHVNLTATFGEMSRKEEAQASAVEVLRINPEFSCKKYVEGLSYSDPAEATRFEEALRNAGLPD
jgi:TolB-like protein/predicted TPR repeat methyltransferase